MFKLFIATALLAGPLSMASVDGGSLFMLISKTESQFETYEVRYVLEAPDGTSKTVVEANHPKLKSGEIAKFVIPTAAGKFARLDSGAIALEIRSVDSNGGTHRWGYRADGTFVGMEHYSEFKWTDPSTDIEYTVFRTRVM